MHRILLQCFAGLRLPARWVAAAFLASAILLSVAPRWSAAAPNTDSWRWKWSVGDTLRYRVDSESEASSSVGLVAKTHRSEILRMGVFAIQPDGTAQVEIMVEWFREERQADPEGDGTFTPVQVWDSDAESDLSSGAEPDLMVRLARAGQPYLVRIDSSGRFSDIAMPDQGERTWQRLGVLRERAGLPREPETVDRAVLDKEIRRTLDARLWQSLWVPLPAAKVGVGQSEIIRLERPSLFDGKVILEVHAIRRPNDPRGRVTFDQRGPVRLDLPPIPDVEIHVDKFERTGFQAFHPSGWIDEQTEDLTAVTTISLAEPGKPAQKRTMSMRSRFTVTRLE